MGNIERSLIASVADLIYEGFPIPARLDSRNDVDPLAERVIQVVRSHDQLEGAVDAWRELWDALARQVDHDEACPDDGTCDLCRLAPPTAGGAVEPWATSSMTAGHSKTVSG